MKTLTKSIFCAGKPRMRNRLWNLMIGLFLKHLIVNVQHTSSKRYLNESISLLSRSSTCLNRQQRASGLTGKLKKAFKKERQLLALTKATRRLGGCPVQ